MPTGKSLALAGWTISEDGEILNGQLQCTSDRCSCFKHSQCFQAGDVLRMKVEGNAIVGIAAEGYDVERDRETHKSTARVFLSDGTTAILSDISPDGGYYYHDRHLKELLPKTKPYDVALCINRDGNLPQIQFNDDGVWHDFAPDRVGLKAGPWFPYLMLGPGDCSSDHHVVHVALKREEPTLPRHHPDYVHVETAFDSSCELRMTFGGQENDLLMQGEKLAAPLVNSSSRSSLGAVGLRSGWTY